MPSDCNNQPDSRLGFFHSLESLAKSRNSLLCVGLDPHFEIIQSWSDLVSTPPEFLYHDTDQWLIKTYSFCFRVIEATHDLVCCYKPNIAFFEQLGPGGLEVLERICALINQYSIPIILDCKRGDIGSTAISYARAAYRIPGVTATTCSPYMGRDSILPFLGADYAKGCFVLCKTSNASSNDLQTLMLRTSMKDTASSPLFLYVADMCHRIQKDFQGEFSIYGGGIGLVVGGTDLEALQQVRQRLPSCWILCPGIGTQGGQVLDALKCGLRSDFSGLLLNVSRSISSAPDMRAKCLNLIKEIQQGVAMLQARSSNDA